jgi:hypothetical protein
MSDRRRYRRTGYLDTVEHLEQLNVPIIEELKREVASIYENEEKNPTVGVPIQVYVNAFEGIIYRGNLFEGFMGNSGFREEFEDSNLTEYIDFKDFEEALKDILKRYLKEPVRHPYDFATEITLEDIERLEDKTWEEFTKYIGDEFANSAYEYEDDDELSPEAREFGDAVIDWIREVKFYDPDDDVWDDLKMYLFD